MEQQTISTQGAGQSEDVAVSWRERVSAAVDGTDPAGVADWVRACTDQPDLAQAWREYQWIGDVLRHGDQANPAADPGFVRGVMDRLAAESPVPTVAVSPTVAANDAVFRWRWVAGLAGLGVTVAVLWQVLAGTQGLVPGAQLAAAPALPAAGVQVVVNTPQGAMVRDPELEALMAAHRQSGAMSAFQRPTGFMRNAAFEAGPR